MKCRDGDCEGGAECVEFGGEYVETIEGDRRALLAALDLIERTAKAMPDFKAPMIQRMAHAAIEAATN